MELNGHTPTQAPGAHYQYELAVIPVKPLAYHCDKHADSVELRELQADALADDVEIFDGVLVDQEQVAGLL